jgi:hypothetical protein
VIVRTVCGALAVVLMFLALLFAGAAGAGAGGHIEVPDRPGADARATGGTVPPPPVGETVRTSADLLPGVPSSGYASAFPAGECTSWAAKNHPVLWNGNANEWLSAARTVGAFTSSTPSLGAIVVYAAATPYDRAFGHVAIVTDVGLGTYTVSEMNYLGHGVVDARTVQWPDGHVEGFIP